MRASLLILLALSGLATAWGGLGHQTVAFLASNFVKSETAAFFQNVLSDDTPEYLANVATWADSYRYTTAGRFSAPFHFIDAIDNPPSACGVSYSRDCGKTGCIVGAIQNYTSRVLDTELAASERSMAAKFVVHFLGDIHQPLHDEHLDRGGNSINVTFEGVVTNLHSIWDTNMPEKLIGGYSLVHAQSWAATLTASIKAGAYKAGAASWLIGIKLSDPVDSSLIWAKEANNLICSTVLSEGKEGVAGKELSGAYYEAAVPVIELQIARAGYRLATWLDLIAAGTKTFNVDL